MPFDWDGDGEIDELDWILTDMVLFDDEDELEDAEKKPSTPCVKRNVGCLPSVMAFIGVGVIIVYLILGLT